MVECLAKIDYVNKTLTSPSHPIYRLSSPRKKEAHFSFNIQYPSFPRIEGRFDFGSRGACTSRESLVTRMYDEKSGREFYVKLRLDSPASRRSSAFYLLIGAPPGSSRGDPERLSLAAPNTIDDERFGVRKNSIPITL